MIKPPHHSLIIGIFIIAATVLSISQRAIAQDCSSFQDPGAVVCYTFESGSLSGWYTAGDASLVTPGLFGNYKLQLHIDHVSSSCPQGQAKPDTTVEPPGFSFHAANGQTYWVEWTVTYESNFRWSFGCDPAAGWDGNSNHKDIDLRIADSAGGQNRILFSPTDGGNNGQIMEPLWAIYAGPDMNYVPNVVGAPTIRAGDTVHFVVEIHNATGSNGHFKMWANGQLLMDYSGFQTCRSSSGCDMNAIHFGGPQSNANVQYGNTWSYDDFRITRTNIAPSGASQLPTQLPAAPSSLTIK